LLLLLLLLLLLALIAASRQELRHLTSAAAAAGGTSGSAAAAGVFAEVHLEVAAGPQLCKLKLALKVSEVKKVDARLGAAYKLHIVLPAGLCVISTREGRAALNDVHQAGRQAGGRCPVLLLLLLLVPPAPPPS
jgi:hypothetical protein